MKTAKVENKEHLVRDLDTKAVLNTNVGALNAHLRQREQLKKIDIMEHRINNINEKVDMIIRMLSGSDK